MIRFAKIIGLALTIAGVILYVPPLYDLLMQSFGEAGRLTAPITYASGWALLLGCLAFNLGMHNGKK